MELKSVSVAITCLLLVLIKNINSVELTFELPDSSKECFYEDIVKNSSVTLEYQVNEFINFQELYHNLLIKLVFCCRSLLVVSMM